MGTALVLVALLALPFVAQWAVRALRGVVFRRWEQARERRRPVAPTLPPIERVAADLRRLRSQLESRENRPGTTGKGMRMGALRVAYVEVLAAACAQLDIEPPHPAAADWQTPLAEIYRVESQLRERGLDVRQPAERRWDAA